ncbi:MAG TPA: DinB family protein [Chryseolinea sp.]|nr:DinB family protein [Chryseolinea sp.]
MSYSILQHLEFNAWANGMMIETLKPLSDELFYRGNQGSFPSIAKTTLHIWGSQHIWYRRMQGESLKQAPMVAEPPSKVDILEGLMNSSKDFVMFINSVSPALLSGRYHYTNLRGESCDDTYEETLYHIVNHGTYHRGQLILMLRECGVSSLPGTDLIHYLRAQRK